MLTAGRIPVYCYRCVAGPDLLPPPLRAGPIGVALGVLGYGAAWACAALAFVVADPAPVAALAGAFMITGQCWAKWLLIRRAGLVRPVTMSILAPQRRRP